MLKRPPELALRSATCDSLLATPKSLLFTLERPEKNFLQSACDPQTGFRRARRDRRCALGSHPGSFSIGRLALYVFQRLFVKAEIVAELVEYGKAHLFADDLFDRATFFVGHVFRVGFDVLLVKHDAVRPGIRAEKALLGARRAFKDAHQQIARVASLGRMVFDHHGNILNVLAELPRQGIHRLAHQLKKRLAPHNDFSLIDPTQGEALNETIPHLLHLPAGSTAWALGGMTLSLPRSICIRSRRERNFASFLVPQNKEPPKPLT